MITTEFEPSNVLALDRGRERERERMPVEMKTNVIHPSEQVSELLGSTPGCSGISRDDVLATDFLVVLAIINKPLM